MNGRRQSPASQNKEEGLSGPESGTPGLTGALDEDIRKIRTALGGSPDLKVRKILVGKEHPIQAAAVHISGLADATAVNEFVIGSLLADQPSWLPEETGSQEAFPARLVQRVLELGDAQVTDEWNDLLLAVLSGDTAVLADGYTSAVICDTKGGETRAVEESSSQMVVRGPKDGFVESVATNISLIRRRIKSPKLRLEYTKIGTETQTHVAMLYMKEIAGEDLVAEARRRLNKISIDEVLESGFIEELIQDKTFTPFPTIYNSERPDVAAGNLLEGRVVIIVDGTPFVLILPAVFTQFFQSAEDYSQRFDIAILMRLVRYVSFIVLLLGPSVYIALTTYHYEMIPTTLLINLLSQRETVPFLPLWRPF